MIDVYQEFKRTMTLPCGTSVVTNEMFDWLKFRGFFTAPASATHHGNYPGGLAEHSIAVTKCLLALTEKNNLVWKSYTSPYIIGMFHDLCKIDNYIPIYDKNVTDPVAYKWNQDTFLKGHGEKSVMLLSQFYRLTEEEIMCIRYHMGAFTDREEWQDYTRAVSRYQNVLWTHTADMLAVHVVRV